MHISRAQGSLLLAGFLTYVVMGALVFEILEKDHHKKVIDTVFQLKQDFFLNYTSLSPEDVESFIQKVIASVRKGIIPIGYEAPEKNSDWDFSNSFFFVGTMLSTIGYGNVCPQTKEGQIFCIIFALFGIPFNLICLNYIGFLVSRLFERCARKIWGRGKKKTKRYIFLFVAVGIVMFLILPSFLFQWMEGWTYHEAVYFTFITLSTIGFGDYLIGRKYDRTYFPGYQLLSAVWIIIGLAWIAVLFEIVSSLLAPADPKASSQRSKQQR
ncbi:potassium channel subfamily K member 16-like [Lacerta agilis]|uniref:potassium channel subfamily K member 16-like n=1 Tax=Lacerta agilis TaxID=80427 RepID=UPI001419F808|nr:potassium channel subfamily K member 16-like [Lacerta agilis]